MFHLKIFKILLAVRFLSNALCFFPLKIYTRLRLHYSTVEPQLFEKLISGQCFLHPEMKRCVDRWMESDSIIRHTTDSEECFGFWRKRNGELVCNNLFGCMKMFRGHLMLQICTKIHTSFYADGNLPVKLCSVLKFILPENVNYFF